MSFKLASWNINSIHARIESLLLLIQKHNPDVICLQEIKTSEEKFPFKLIEDTSYNVYFSGQKTFNGVAILTKNPAEIVIKDFPGNPISEEARFIEIHVTTSLGFTKIVSVYVPNGEEALYSNEKFMKKCSFLESFIKYSDSYNPIDENVIIAGDFNIAPFKVDHIEDSTTDEKKICISLKEKMMLRKFINYGWVDHFRLLNPHLQEFSWWDYRGRSFEKNIGYRIDFIFSNAKSLTNLKTSLIDKDFRELSKPSDHAVLISTWM